MFDRQADDSGKADWLAKLSNGMSRSMYTADLQIHRSLQMCAASTA